VAKLLDLSFDGSDVRVVSHLQATSRLLQETLVAKMTALMTRVQYRLRQKYSSGKYATGELANSVSNPRAEIGQGQVIGRLDVSSPHAQFVEEGTKAHVIYPKEVIIKGTMASLGKAAVRRQVIGKAALHFYSDRLGKAVFADYVFKDPISGKYHVRNTLNDMQEEFRKGIQEALEGVMKR